MFSIPFTVEKSIEINKPVKQVFNFVADFANWSCWSPWLIQEPDCPITRQGEAASLGHAQAWDGKQSGKGEIKISALQQDVHLNYDLTFYAPWKSQSTAQFVFEDIQLASGEAGCKVTWLMQGSYLHLANGWATLMGYLQNRNNKLKANKKIPEYEVYLNSPADVAESELKTVIYAPVK